MPAVDNSVLAHHLELEGLGIAASFLDGGTTEVDFAELDRCACLDERASVGLLDLDAAHRDLVDLLPFGVVAYEIYLLVAEDVLEVGLDVRGSHGFAVDLERRLEV